MGENTTLAELLGLNLHECEEEVKNIVDKAVKEMSMEKILRDLDTTWSKMEFEHEIHPRTQCSLLKGISTANSVNRMFQCFISYPKHLHSFGRAYRNVGRESSLFAKFDNIKVHCTFSGGSFVLAKEIDDCRSSDYGKR